MSRTLRLEPLGHELPLADDQTLLQAARAVGVELRSSCRVGTCRECMALLTEGRVHYRIEWPGLLAEEKAEGWVLPCVALAHPEAGERLVLQQPKLVVVPPPSPPAERPIPAPWRPA
jgi:ferredoxin